MANVALITMVVCIWSNATQHRLLAEEAYGRLVLGIATSVAMVAIMNMHTQVSPGVYIDLRGGMITLAALFGGPAVAAIGAAAGVAYRMHLGGAGAIAGSVGIILPALIGLWGHAMARKHGLSLRLLVMVALNGSLACALCLGVLPWSIMFDVAREAALPLVIFNAMATMLGGFAMLNEVRRRELLRANDIYRMAIDLLPDCLNVKDAEGRFLIANAATARLMNSETPDRLIGKTDADFYPPEVANRVMAEERAAISEGKPSLIEQRVCHAGRKDIWLSTLKVPLLDGVGRLTGLITHNRDISEQRKLSLDLAQSQQHFSDALENMPGGVAMFDAHGTLVYFNQRYREMFPLTAGLRVTGANYRDIFIGALDQGELAGGSEASAADLAKSPQDLLLSRDKVQFQLSDGRWVETHVRFTLAGACFALYNDITQLKAKEAKLVELNSKLTLAAVTDGLTGLANRRAFDECLNHETKRASRGCLPLSLVLIDVDRFKKYNDTYGHPAGDECLRVLAQCMQETARRPGDLAARYGGEELALILPLTGEAQAIELAHRLRQLVRARAIRHETSEKGIVTVSIGVASLGEGDSTDVTAAQLLRRADEALYTAKSAGRDAVRCIPSPAVAQPILRSVRA